MTSRRGRRPAVSQTDNGDFYVKVGDRTFGFRAGSDGKLRALGQPDRSTEEFGYAKGLVKGTIESMDSGGDTDGQG